MLFDALQVQAWDCGFEGDSKVRTQKCMSDESTATQCLGVALDEFIAPL